MVDGRVDTFRNEINLMIKCSYLCYKDVFKKQWKKKVVCLQLTPAYRHGLEIYKELRLATYWVDALKRVGCSLHLCATLEEEGDDITAYIDSRWFKWRFSGLSPSVYVTHRLFTFSGKRFDFLGCNFIHATVSVLHGPSALRWIVASNVSAFRTNLFFLNKFLLFNFTNRSSPPSLLLPSLSLSTFLHGCIWYFACVKPDLLHFPHSVAWKRLALQKLDVQERGKIYRVP